MSRVGELFHLYRRDLDDQERVERSVLDVSLIGAASLLAIIFVIGIVSS